jgi:hypothetical protein
MTYLTRSLSALSLLILSALALPAAAQQSGGLASCTRGCVSLLQTIGDEMKQQIFLECDQIGGVCKGTGALTVAGTDIPVRIEGNVGANELTLTIKGDGAVFAPSGSDAIHLDLAPDQAQQAYRVDLVRVPDMGAAPIAVSIVITKII